MSDIVWVLGFTKHHATVRKGKISLCGVFLVPSVYPTGDVIAEQFKCRRCLRILSQRPQCGPSSVRAINVAD